MGRKRKEPSVCTPVLPDNLPIDTSPPPPRVSLLPLVSLPSDSGEPVVSQTCKNCALWEQLPESAEHGECHLQPFPLVIPAGSLLQSKFIPGIFLVMRESQWCNHFKPINS